jgi:hypothetical protein
MTITGQIRGLSLQDFAHLGLDEVAYVKRVVDNGVVRYAIHAADGTEMGVMLDRATAAAALRQNDLEPVSVH